MLIGMTAIIVSVLFIVFVLVPEAWKDKDSIIFGRGDVYALVGSVILFGIILLTQ